MNLARKHFQQHQAKSAAETAAEFGTMRNTNAYEQQLLQLNSDKIDSKYSVQTKQNRIKAPVNSKLQTIRGRYFRSKTWCSGCSNY